MLAFFSKTFTARTTPGTRQSIQHESYIVHCYVRPDGLAGTVTTDLEYPPRVAFVMLTQLLEEYATGEWIFSYPSISSILLTTLFHPPPPLSQHQAVGDAWKSAAVTDSIPYPPLEEYVSTYQDPTSADKITKIQKDLDDTTEILHKTIDNVLERGVKLDQLVERSDDLSRQSKMFYKQARKTNSCCVIS